DAALCGIAGIEGSEELAERLIAHQCLKLADTSLDLASVLLIIDGIILVGLTVAQETSPLGKVVNGAAYFVRVKASAQCFGAESLWQQLSFAMVGSRFGFPLHA